MGAEDLGFGGRKDFRTTDPREKWYDADTELWLKTCMSTDRQSLTSSYYGCLTPERWGRDSRGICFPAAEDTDPDGTH